MAIRMPGRDRPFSDVCMYTANVHAHTPYEYKGYRPWTKYRYENTKTKNRQVRAYIALIAKIQQSARWVSRTSSPAESPRQKLGRKGRNE